MNRTLSLALAAAMVAAGAGGASGQDVDGRRAGRFDVAVYAGGSLTSAWFESRTLTLNGTDDPTENDDGESFQPGYAPFFGAHLTFWATPVIGLRVHGAYAPMRLPSDPSDGFFDGFDNVGERAAYTLNSWFYDAELVVRPFFNATSSRLLSSVYFWAGGGGLTVDQAGEDLAVCQATLLTLGACLSHEPAQATVGQGTAGAGIDLFWLGRSLALFGEAGVHVYDSPVHVGDEWVGPITAPTGARVRVADDRTAVTPRLVVGLKLVLGDLLPAPVIPPPPPPPEIAPPLPPQLPPPAPVTHSPTVRICVVEGGALTEVEARYNQNTGDTTTMDGRRFGEAYPTGAQYAASAPWYINNEPVTFNGRRYVKYGLPRVLGTTEITRAGELQGVPVFAETGGATPPEVIYVPVRPGCEFQPYQGELKTGGVRG
jgi:hypothetical protein